LGLLVKIAIRLVLVILAIWGLLILSDRSVLLASSSGGRTYDMPSMTGTQSYSERGTYCTYFTGVGFMRLYWGLGDQTCPPVSTTSQILVRAPKAISILEIWQ
jgi:hypothetical protein